MPADTPRTVSVVIPTLGRPELRRALASVRDQGVPVETIVVNDSGAPLDLSDVDLPGLRVIDTTGREGASAARNRGMSLATGELIAFLDDDDVWLDSHLRDALAYLDEHPDVDVYASRGLVTYDDGTSRLEPVDCMAQSSSFLDYTFGPGVWMTRGRRILTPTLVFRRSLAGHTFDTSLRAREDTWWLLTAERDGHRIVQSMNVGVHVKASRDRAVGRDSYEEQMDFARRVDSIRPGRGVLQLVSAARAQGLAGEVGDVVTLARGAAQLPGSRPFLPLFGLAGGVGVLRTAISRVRGR